MSSVRDDLMPLCSVIVPNLSLCTSTNPWLPGKGRTSCSLSKVTLLSHPCKTCLVERCLSCVVYCASQANRAQTRTRTVPLPTPYAPKSPPRDDHFLIGVKLNRVLPVSLEIPEERTLGASKREERHGRRDADVHADHADADAIAELARGLAALREDGRRIREPRAMHHLDPLVQVADMAHGRHGTEDLFLADRHVGLHAIEDGGADKVAARVLLDLARAAVE